MSEITVTPDQITAVAGQVASGANEIETQRAALLSQIQGLGDTWQGAAASALQALYQQWDADIRALQNTLTEIGQTMRTAADAYQTTESGITRSFS